jgi:hypothetical protein
MDLAIERRRSLVGAVRVSEFWNVDIGAVEVGDGVVGFFWKTKWAFGGQM